MLHRSLTTPALLATLLLSTAVRAEGLAVPIDLMAAGAIKVNGVLTDWPASMTPLRSKVSGNPGAGKDLEARVGLAADDDALYFAADLTDDRLTRTASYGQGEDHFTLVLAFPGEGAAGNFSVLEVDVFHGDPGNVAGAALIRGAKVGGASVVEAPKADKSGFTVEAKIPWAALPPAARVRVGLRGAVRYTDSDGGLKGVLGTSAESQPGKMPRLPTDAERAIEESFAKEKGLTGAPQVEFIADVTGDDQRERVMLWDHFVLIAGPHFRDGKQFHFSDLGVDRGQIPLFEVRDLAGTGKAQLIVRKRKGGGTGWREVLEVQAMSGDALAPIFAHDVGVSTDAGTIRSNVKLEPKQIEISLGDGSGLSAATFALAPEAGVEPLLLPWGTVKSRTFRHDGTRFTKSREEAKPAGDPGSSGPRAPAAPEVPAPPPPRPPTADEMQDRVLDLYRKDRKVDAKARPRFDLATDVAEDRQNERILVFGRDLVVFGKGFQGGQGYTALSVGFADARDVSDVTTRDLNGDGKAEILVRGVQKIEAPKDLGKGELVRELLLVYSVQGGKLVRVLAAETGMSVGDNRVSGTIAFLPAARGLDLQLGPGHSVGWEQKSFPIRQETAPINGIEPLVLPWSSAVRLRWSGAGYAR